MELFEEIQRGRAAGETILGPAKKHNMHRRMVRQAGWYCPLGVRREAPYRPPRTASLI